MTVDLDTSAARENGAFHLDSVPVAEEKPNAANAPKNPRYTRVEIGGFGRPLVLALLVVLFAASVGDFVNAKTVFDLIFTRSASYNAWVLAISLTGLAIIATHTAGYLWREAHAHRAIKTLSLAIVGAWLAAGTLLALLRVAVGSGTTPVSSSSGNPFGGLNLGGNEMAHPAVLAAVLGAIWVTTGLVSFSIGYLAHAPAGAALARLEKTTEKHSREFGGAISKQRQAAHTLEAQRLNRARLREAWRRADAAAGARRDELQAWARLELVRLLADPAATNDILPRPDTEKKA
jgi:hypothetical protein